MCAVININGSHTGTVDNKETNGLVNSSPVPTHVSAHAMLDKAHFSVSYPPM